MFRKLFSISNSSNKPSDGRKEEKKRKQPPRYPPPPNALEIVPPEELLESQKTLVRDFEHAITLPVEETERLIRPVLLRFAETVQLLPASEFHHHSDPGGFLYHSLEVGLKTLLKLKHHFVLDTNKPPPRRKFLEVRWQACYAFSGLMHDIGRVLTDLLVIGEDGSVWNPMLEPLYQWGRNREIEHYYAAWIRNRVGRHEKFAACFLHFLLPRDTLRWLSLSWTEAPITQMPKEIDPLNIDPDDKNLEPVNEAFITLCSFLAGNECRILSKLVRESDWESVRKDLKRRGKSLDYPEPVHEQEFNTTSIERRTEFSAEDELNLCSKGQKHGSGKPESKLNTSSIEPEGEKPAGSKLNTSSNNAGGIKTESKESEVKLNMGADRSQKEDVETELNKSSSEAGASPGITTQVQDKVNKNDRDQKPATDNAPKFNKKAKRIVPGDSPADRMILALAKAAAEHPEWVRLKDRLLEHPEMAHAAGIAPGECVRTLFEAGYIEPDPDNILRKVTIQEGKSWLKVAKGLMWLFEEVVAGNDTRKPVNEEADKPRLTARQEELLRILSEGDLPLREIRKRLTTPPSDRMLQLDLEYLRDIGLVKLEGRGPGATYGKAK